MDRSALIGLRFNSREMKPGLIILLPALLVALSKHLGSMEFALHSFPFLTRFGQVMYMFMGIFLLFGIIPLLIVRVLFRESPREYGLRVGDWKAGLLMTGILFPVIAICLLLPASHTAEIRAVYPFDSEALHSAGAYARLQLLRNIFFYTAWEFLFRGFLLFGLRRYVGDWLAISIQTVPSCLWHIGMATGEVLSSIAGGILFGIMALRTNSILWPLLLHILMGMSLDLFIAFTS